MRLLSLKALNALDDRHEQDRDEPGQEQHGRALRDGTPHQFRLQNPLHWRTPLLPIHNHNVAGGNHVSLNVRATTIDVQSVHTEDRSSYNVSAVTSTE